MVYMSMLFEKSEKAFDGVDFAGDGFGGVLLIFQMSFELIEMICLNYV